MNYPFAANQPPMTMQDYLIVFGICLICAAIIGCWLLYSIAWIRGQFVPEYKANKRI